MYLYLKGFNTSSFSRAEEVHLLFRSKTKSSQNINYCMINVFINIIYKSTFRVVHFISPYKQTKYCFVSWDRVVFVNPMLEEEQ